MSVVNEMLKELQKDQGQHKAFDGFVASDTEKPVSKLFWRSIAVLILFLVSYIVYVEYQRESLLGKPEVMFTNQTDLATEADISNSKPLSSENLSTQPISVASVEKNRVVNNNQSLQDSNQIEAQTEESDNDSTLTSISTKKTPADPVEVNTNNQVELAIKVDNAAKTIETITSPIDSTSDSSSKRNSDTSTDTFNVITRSQKNIEEQQIAKLMKEWKNRSISENREQALLLKNSVQQSQNQHKLLRFIQPRNASLFKQLLVSFVEKNPNDIQLRNRSAKQLFLEKKYQATVSELLTVNRTKWDKVSYQLAALAEQKQSNHEQAIIYFETLLSLQPNRGDISMALAISYEASMKKPLAIETFRHALRDKQLSNIQKKFIRQRLVALQG